MERYEEKDDTQVWLVRYSEIFLKSDPVRREWEKVLMSHIREVLPGVSIKSERGRIWVSGDVDPDILGRVFGIISFSKCLSCSLDDLDTALIKFCKETDLVSSKSFALRIKREGEHKFNSQDIAVRLGNLVRQRYPHIKVDLSSPEKEISVEIRDDRCYIFESVYPGPGGLPPGVEGTLVALVSGGIDSPVAAWMMMKRGCTIIPLYIALEGFLDEVHITRAMNVVERLRPWQPDIGLVVIHDDYLLKAKKVLMKERKEKYTCLLCKRRMYRVASAFAGAHNAKGIVTGESLGQVASQTLDNLMVLNDAADLPVYRPLIGLDKDEIIRIARKIGTFQPSVIKTGGCGAVPKIAATCSTVSGITELENSVRRENEGADRFPVFPGRG